MLTEKKDECVLFRSTSRANKTEVAVGQTLLLISHSATTWHVFSCVDFPPGMKVNMKKITDIIFISVALLFTAQTKD